MPEIKTELIIELQVKLTESVLNRLNAMAREQGKDRDVVISDLVQAAKPRTLAEVLGPVHEEFRRSAMSDAELDDLLESELRAYREGR